jgi:hypothetical protein
LGIYLFFLSSRCFILFLSFFFIIIVSFPQEKGVFVKERGAGYYRVSPYYFTRGKKKKTKKMEQNKKKNK